jgi:hypothetical protein
LNYARLSFNSAVNNYNNKACFLSSPRTRLLHHTKGKQLLAKTVNVVEFRERIKIRQNVATNGNVKQYRAAVLGLEKQQVCHTIIACLCLELIIKQANSTHGISMPHSGLYGSAQVFLAISCTSRGTEENFEHKNCVSIFPTKCA